MLKKTLLFVSAVLVIGLSTSAPLDVARGSATVFAQASQGSRRVAAGDWPEQRGPSRDGVSRETMNTLSDYSWPGNVWELQNVIERGVILTKRPVLFLGPDLLPIERPELDVPQPASSADTSASLKEVERRHILNVLESTGWRLSGAGGAAAVLGLHPNTLRSRMDRLGIRRARHAIS